MRKYLFLTIFCAAAWVPLFFSCEFEGTEEDSGLFMAVPDTVRRINVSSSGNGSIALDGLEGSEVFLVEVNPSVDSVYRKRAGRYNGYADRDRLAETAVLDVSAGPSGAFSADGGGERPRSTFHPPVVYPGEDGLLSMRNPVRSPERNQAARSVVSYSLGARKSFYVDVGEKKIDAQLRGAGSYCDVWVADDSYDDPSNTGDTKITADQAQELAARFDLIYPLETALLGYEYGGGPGGNGGADGNAKIQILVYRIADPGVAGYFYSGDEFSRSEKPHSNEAEIFYISTRWFALNPDLTYSTLIHEFNHMINYNVKVLQNRARWETWYTEMLSMLAEDVIGPMVGISATNRNHVTPSRIPTWLKITALTWTSGEAWNQTADAYAPAYAFGAYLVRNFGGAKLLSAIAMSPFSGAFSIERSLQDRYGNAMTLDYAISRFGEALVYSGERSPQAAVSLSKTVTSTIAGNEYTFYGFDIWKANAANENWTGEGPLLYDGSVLSGYTAVISGQWQNQRGRLVISLADVNPALKYYAIIR
jgi:hypothetical protein